MKPRGTKGQGVDPFNHDTRSNSGGAQRRLLIVDDDDAAVRNWTRTLRDEVTVHRAATMAQALALTAPVTWRRSHYDYLFLDVRLPDGNGLDLLERFGDLSPAPAVAVLSGFLTASDVLRVHRHGGIAVPKPADREVIRAIVAMLSAMRHGETVIDKFAAAHRLSPQETRLLAEALREATNDEAAEVLGCSSSTVRTYWSRIFEKTSCHRERDVVVRLYRLAATEARAQPPRPHTSNGSEM